jgi:hypothetical protein
MTTECWDPARERNGGEREGENKRRSPGDRIRWAPDNWMIEPVGGEATDQSLNSGSLTHSHRIPAVGSPFIGAIRFLIDFCRLSPFYFIRFLLFPFALHLPLLCCFVWCLPARLCCIKWPVRGATSRTNKHRGVLIEKWKKFFNSPLSDLLLGNCK